MWNRGYLGRLLSVAPLAMNPLNCDCATGVGSITLRVKMTEVQASQKAQANPTPGEPETIHSAPVNGQLQMNGSIPEVSRAFAPTEIL